MKDIFYRCTITKKDSIPQVAHLFAPWLLVGYLVSSGFVSDLSNVFAGILVLAGLILFLINRKFEVPIVINVMIWLGLFLSSMVFAHAILGGNIPMLFNFQFENMRNLAILAFIAALFSTLNIGPQFFWRMIILAGLYTFILAILIFSEGAVRGHGWLSEAIKVGNFGVLFSLLAIVAFFGVQGRFWKFLAFVVIVSGLAISVLSQTRAGWVAFLVAIMILLWAFNSIDKRYFYTLLAALAALVVSVFLMWNSLPIEARIFQAVEDVNRYFMEGYANTSVGARLDMWYITLHAFAEKPIFGWGVVPFKETFIASVEQGVGKIQLIGGMADGFAQPHNDYMFTLYHFGLIGFIGVLAFLFTPITYLISVVRKQKQANVNEVNKQVILLAVAGLLALEALLDFMMFNLAFNNQILHVVLVIVFLAIFAINTELSKGHTKTS